MNLISPWTNNTLPIPITRHQIKPSKTNIIQYLHTSNPIHNNYHFTFISNTNAKRQSNTKKKIIQNAKTKHYLISILSHALTIFQIHHTKLFQTRLQIKAFIHNNKIKSKKKNNVDKMSAYNKTHGLLFYIKSSNCIQ